MNIFLFFTFHTEKEVHYTYILYVFVDCAFFHLIYLISGCRECLHSFSQLHTISPWSLFYYAPKDKELACSWYSALMNNASVNELEHVSFHASR